MMKARALQIQVDDSTRNEFWSKVKKTATCWNWKGSTNYTYGLFIIKRKLFFAHRFVWLITNGPIPEAMLVCHTCDNTLCVRPNHLFLGTQADNMRDCKEKGRMRNQNTAKKICIRGHPLVESNIVPSLFKSAGRRECLICHKETQRRARDRRMKQMALSQAKVVDVPKGLPTPDGTAPEDKDAP
jgi:hypothetical protein